MAALRTLVPEPLRPAVRRQLVRYRHRGLRAQDAVLVSYPKSGSTWLRFLLGHVLGETEMDFDSVRDLLAPIGRHARAPGLLPNGGRFLRSHEPLSSFFGRPGQPVVYLVRDGRDVIVSYLHHKQRVGEFDGDAASFMRLVFDDMLDGYGRWYDHVLAAVAWGRSSSSPFLTVRYEDLRHDTVGNLARILDFVGVEALDPGRLEQAVTANSKERMRAKEATSSILQSQRAKDVAFVRPEGGPGWGELVPVPLQREFERVARPALEAFGYPLTAP